MLKVGDEKTRLSGNWWRWAVGAAAVGLVVVSWGAPVVGLFGLVPVAIWCGVLARSLRIGVIAGAVLLGLLAYFLLPRGLGGSGRWVPSEVEVYWLYAVLAAVVCGVGASAEGRLRAAARWLAGMVFVGFVAAGFVLVSQLEAMPGDEGVWPGAPGLQVSAGSSYCGSGNCARELDAVGIGARDRMRTHLMSEGFTQRPSLLDSEERLCHLTGLLMTHEVCAEIRDIAPDSVRVTWYVN